MQEIVKYPYCFVCGDENQHGLQAKFFYDGEQAISEITAEKMFEGYRGIYHGGIISTMLDEVMIKSILARKIFAVTVEMTIRYLKPVPVGQKLRFCGRVTRNRGRLYLTEGEALGPDGVPFATATGKYLEAPRDLKRLLTDSTASE